MRHAPPLVAALTGALVALGPAASAQASAQSDDDARTYGFPDTCDADAIANGDADCVDGEVIIDLHADGAATWTRDTVYPRDAFEAYTATYEDWTGTLEEYMDVQLADAAADGTTVSSTVTDDLLTVTFTSELTGDDAFGMGFALASDGELYAAIDISSVSGASMVTLTAPGTVQETNGSLDGLTVTWDAAALAALDELGVNALTSGDGEASSMFPAWMLPTGIGLLVLLGVAGYLGFARRPGPRRAG